MFPCIAWKYGNESMAASQALQREAPKVFLRNERKMPFSKGSAMTTVHAWFSMQRALLEGSSVYRKSSGATVNVTRMSPDKEGKGSFPYDEKYLGEVIREEDGGCVRANRRVPGITRA